MRLRCKTPSFSKSSVKSSLKFLVPSAVYAINNNIYLGNSDQTSLSSRSCRRDKSVAAGLILVPPPIWVILCSFRTVVTTCLYKFGLR